MATQAPQIDRRQSTCPECGKLPIRKSLKGPAPLFCSEECKTRCERRKLSDGRVIIDLAKAWRISRNNRGDAALGAACLSEISGIVDMMNERDRKAGRSTEGLLSYVARTMKGGVYNADYGTMTRADRQRPQTTQPEIAEGLRSIQERLGGQLTNMEANALQFAIEKYS